LPSLMRRNTGAPRSVSTRTLVFTVPALSGSNETAVPRS